MYLMFPCYGDLQFLHTIPTATGRMIDRSFLPQALSNRKLILTGNCKAERENELLETRITPPHHPLQTTK
jgi:hypothetical protein